MKLTIQMMDGKSLPKVPGNQTIVSSSWDIGKLGPDERLDPTGTGSARLLHHLLWKRKSKVARFREQSGLIMGLFFLFDVVIILIVLSYFYFLEHVNIGAKAK